MQSYIKYYLSVGVLSLILFSFIWSRNNKKKYDHSKQLELKKLALQEAKLKPYKERLKREGLRELDPSVYEEDWISVYDCKNCYGNHFIRLIEFSYPSPSMQICFIENQKTYVYATTEMVYLKDEDYSYYEDKLIRPFRERRRAKQARIRRNKYPFHGNFNLSSEKLEALPDSEFIFESWQFIYLDDNNKNTIMDLRTGDEFVLNFKLSKNWR